MHLLSISIGGFLRLVRLLSAYPLGFVLVLVGWFGSEGMPNVLFYHVVLIGTSFPRIFPYVMLALILPWPIYVLLSSILRFSREIVLIWLTPNHFPLAVILLFSCLVLQFLCYLDLLALVRNSLLLLKIFDCLSELISMVGVFAIHSTLGFPILSNLLMLTPIRAPRLLFVLCWDA